jgi:lysophospholipase L1-like esterase
MIVGDTARVTKRGYKRIVAVGAVIVTCCLGLSLWVTVRVRDAAASRAVSAVQIEPHQAWTSAGHGTPRVRTTTVAVATPLAACEARIERQPHRLPTVAIVGASYTAGTGPNNPELSWAVVLPRLLHWNAIIYGVSGAGFVRTSPSGRGPMTRMLAQEELHGLSPALVIVQAGHDDLGVPAGLESRRVRATVDLIAAAAPGARIALLTTFGYSAAGTSALRQLDQAIVTAGTAADPGVIVMDPLAGGGWSYPRANGNGLHPSAAGDAWIAHTVAGILLGNGVQPTAATSTTPVICDVSVGAGKPASATT